jgi:hypothetical protein
MSRHVVRALQTLCIVEAIVIALLLIYGFSTSGNEEPVYPEPAASAYHDECRDSAGRRIPAAYGDDC